MNNGVQCIYTTFLHRIYFDQCLEIYNRLLVLGMPDTCALLKWINPFYMYKDINVSHYFIRLHSAIWNSVRYVLIPAR